MLQNDRYVITADSISCRICLNTSYNPHDVEKHYCGYCKAFLDDLTDQEVIRRKEEIRQNAELVMTPTEQLTEAQLLERAGSILPDDPSLNRQQNLVRYMRRCPTHMPPNKWPEGMIMIGLANGFVTKFGFVSLEKFENLTDAQVCELMPESQRICYIPIIKLPKTQEEIKKCVERMTAGDMLRKTLQYLVTNRWYLDRVQ